MNEGHLKWFGFETKDEGGMGVLGGGGGPLRHGSMTEGQRGQLQCLYPPPTTPHTPTYAHQQESRFSAADAPDFYPLCLFVYSFLIFFLPPRRSLVKVSRFLLLHSLRGSSTNSLNTPSHPPPLPLLPHCPPPFSLFPPRSVTCGAALVILTQH